MILKIYGETDADDLITILINSGYTAKVHRVYEEGPHNEVYIIEVIE